MPPAPAYFQHASAWRAAFFAMMEEEQPTELPFRAVESTAGWIYRQPQPTDKYPHVKRKDIPPKFT